MPTKNSTAGTKSKAGRKPLSDAEKAERAAERVAVAKATAEATKALVQAHRDEYNSHFAAAMEAQGYTPQPSVSWTK